MWLLLFLLAAKKPPPLPMGPQPPHDPGTGPSPYEDRVHQPLLDGSTSTLDLSKLSHATTSFKLTADVSELDQVTDGTQADVLRHLAADPRWRLVEWDGAIVAWERVADGTDWTTPLRGYVEGPHEAWRTALRFGDWARWSPWRGSKLVGRAKTSDPAINLTEFTLPNRLKATAMSWAGSELALEVYDACDNESQAATVAALSTVPNEVAALVRDAPTIEKLGYDPAQMPPQEPHKGEPAAALTSPGAGELELRARVHSAGAGVTWARILDGDLKPWEEVAVGTGTREIIGWSPDPQVLSYFQGRFPVAPGPEFSGTVEVWFQPQGSTVGVRTEAFPITVPAR